MELFVSLLLHRNDNRRLRVPLNFIILQLIFSHPSATGNAAPPGTCVYTHVARSHAHLGLHERAHLCCREPVCVHGFTVFECVQMLLLTVKRQDQAAVPGTALVKTCILNKFCQITLANT